MKVFGCLLLDDYFVYLIYRWIVVNIILKNFVKELEVYKLCCGVIMNELNSKFFRYVIFICVIDENDNNIFFNKGYWRIKGCLLLCDDDEGDVCDGCD